MRGPDIMKIGGFWNSPLLVLMHGSTCFERNTLGI